MGTISALVLVLCMTMVIIGDALMIPGNGDESSLDNEYASDDSKEVGDPGLWRLYAKVKNGWPCWDMCKHKSGPCKACGHGGQCCRKGHGGCGKLQRKVAPTFYHTCVILELGIGPGRHGDAPQELESELEDINDNDEGDAAKELESKLEDINDNDGDGDESILDTGNTSDNSKELEDPNYYSFARWVDGKNCWWKCGKKSGPCKACNYKGKKGQCCRQGWRGCGHHQISVAPWYYHTCIVMRYGRGDESSSKELEDPSRAVSKRSTPPRPCHSEVARIEYLEKKYHLQDAFTPACQKNGYFRKRQCYRFTIPMSCWCVFPQTGKRISGTRKFGRWALDFVKC